MFGMRVTGFYFVFSYTEYYYDYFMIENSLWISPFGINLLFFTSKGPVKIKLVGTFLVQWLRIHLQKQGTQV